MLLTRSEDLWSEVGVCFGGFVSGSAGASKVKKEQKDRITTSSAKVP